MTTERAALLHLALMAKEFGGWPSERLMPDASPILKYAIDTHVFKIYREEQDLAIERAKKDPKNPAHPNNRYFKQRKKTPQRPPGSTVQTILDWN